MAKTDKVEEKNLAVNIDTNTTPILYTDMISVTANNFGLVCDVMQRIGNTPQVKVVARIGMSREHAKRFVAELNRLLILTEGQGQTDSKIVN